MKWTFHDLGKQKFALVMTEATPTKRIALEWRIDEDLVVWRRDPQAVVVLQSYLIPYNWVLT